MLPQTKGTGSTDNFRSNAPQTPHDSGAGLHWRHNTDYTALGAMKRQRDLSRFRTSRFSMAFMIGSRRKAKNRGRARKE